MDREKDGTYNRREGRPHGSCAQCQMRQMEKWLSGLSGCSLYYYSSLFAQVADLGIVSISVHTDGKLSSGKCTDAFLALLVCLYVEARRRHCEQDMRNAL